jgi:hypothetical protein
MVAQDVGVRGSEGLDIGKSDRGENECCEKNDDGVGAHGRSMARSPETVKARVGDNYFFTVVFQAMVYYGRVVLDRKIKSWH